jgi:hypothetical protein
MKHLILLTWLLPAISQSLLAQDSLSQKQNILSAKITTLIGHISKGYFYAMTDSALLISTQKQPLRWYDTANKGMYRFEYKDLAKAEIYKKGKVGRSVLTGLLIGAGVGAVIGFASGDDSKDQWFALTAGEKAFGLGVFGGGLGAITGLIVGLAAHKTFVIRGKKENYERMRKKMIKKLRLSPS